MKTKYCIKKAWTKPEVHALSIKKDTFSGSIYGPEGSGKSNVPINPQPH